MTCLEGCFRKRECAEVTRRSENEEEEGLLLAAGLVTYQVCIPYCTYWVITPFGGCDGSVCGLEVARA